MRKILSRFLCRLNRHKWRSIEIEIGRFGGPHIYTVVYSNDRICTHCNHLKPGGF